MNKKINLTLEERHSLMSHHKELRKVKGNTNLAYRINAILLLDDGFSVEQVAKCLLLHDETIRNYVDMYKNGNDGELTKLSYIGKSSSLTKSECESLSQFVESTVFMTVGPIISHVHKQYGILYSVSGMTKLLHSIGFSYKKPKLVGSKANQDKQEQFIKEFEELYSKLDFSKSAVVFADGVHPQHNTVNDYGWIRTNQDKYVKSNTGRERINVLAAVDIDNKDLTYCVNDSVNAYSVLNLFVDLSIKYKTYETIYVICDNAKYFHSNIVKIYLESKTCRIKMIPLPTYSPNLNVIERLWSIMRKEVISNQCYEKFKDFENAIKGFLDNCWTNFKNKLESKLNYNFHKLPHHAYL